MSPCVFLVIYLVNKAASILKALRAGISLQLQQGLLTSVEVVLLSTPTSYLCCMA